MQITFSNEITIEKPIKEITEYCEKHLVVDNPEYFKKQRLGLWLGRTPERLYLYKVNGDKLICPIGAWKDIKGIITMLKIKASYKRDLAHNEPISYNADISLYDYQQIAVDKMSAAGCGILQSAAGSGKTQMGIGIVDKLGCKTLWLTHTHDLLKQSYDRAISCGIDKSLLGTITEGKVNIGKGITFATVQTLAKQGLNQYKYTWDMIIVDECHRCAGTPTAVTQFSKVLNSLAARYKIGLSATVHRADGLIKTTYALLGPIAYIVPEEAVKDKIMRVEIRRINTGVEKIPSRALDTDGTIVYSRLITSLCEIETRNHYIVDNLVENAEHYNLILSDRLEHLHILYEMLPADLKEKAVIIDGKMTSKKGKVEREQAIEDMRAGKKHFLFASYKLAKEGLDIPRLDRLHMATPQKDYAVIVQSVGRIGRKFPGKEQPICYDYVDSIGLMQGMFKKRCRSYRKCGCMI